MANASIQEEVSNDIADNLELSMPKKPKLSAISEWPSIPKAKEEEKMTTNSGKY